MGEDRLFEGEEAVLHMMGPMGRRAGVAVSWTGIELADLLGIAIVVGSSPVPFRSRRT